MKKAIIIITMLCCACVIVFYSCNKTTKETSEVADESKQFTVQFVDSDGEVLDSQIVLKGQSIAAPESPEREGYRFIQWDKSLDNIQEDLIINAVYVKTYEVSFLNYDDSIIDVQLIDSGSNAITPTVPNRDGYSFMGWDAAFNEINSDLVIHALFKKQFAVTFLNENGTVIDRQYAARYDELQFPGAPNKEGYNFVNWDYDPSLTELESDISIKPLYEIKTYSVTFLMPDGSKIDEQRVTHGYFAQAPQYPKAIYQNKKKACFAFTNWSEPFDSVTSDLSIDAVYETPIEGLSVVVLTETIGRKATAEVYLVGAQIIYGFDLKILCDLVIEACNIKSEHMSTEPKTGNTVIEYGGTKKTVEIVYSGSGVPVEIDGVYAVAELAFTIPLAGESQYEIIVKEDSFFVSSSLTSTRFVVVSEKISSND